MSARVTMFTDLTDRYTGGTHLEKVQSTARRTNNFQHRMASRFQDVWYKSEFSSCWECLAWYTPDCTNPVFHRDNKSSASSIWNNTSRNKISVSTSLFDILSFVLFQRWAFCVEHTPQLFITAFSNTYCVRRKCRWWNM